MTTKNLTSASALCTERPTSDPSLKGGKQPQRRSNSSANHKSTPPSREGMGVGLMPASPSATSSHDTLREKERRLWASATNICCRWLRGSGLSSREIAKDSDTWCGLQVSCRIWTRRGPQLRLTASLPTLARSREDMLSVRSCKPSLKVLVIGETTPTGRERLAKSLATPAASSGADFEIVWENPIPKPYKE